MPRRLAAVLVASTALAGCGTDDPGPVISRQAAVTFRCAVELEQPSKASVTKTVRRGDGYLVSGRYRGRPWTCAATPREGAEDPLSAFDYTLTVTVGSSAPTTPPPVPTVPGGGCASSPPPADMPLPSGVPLNTSGTTPALGVPTERTKTMLTAALRSQPRLQFLLDPNLADLRTVVDLSGGADERVLGIVGTYALTPPADLPTTYGLPRPAPDSGEEEGKKVTDEEGLAVLDPVRYRDGFTQAVGVQVFVSTVHSAPEVHYITPTGFIGGPCG